MALSNMQVYDNEIYTTTMELLGQKLEVFNAASGGAVWGRRGSSPAA